MSRSVLDASLGTCLVCGGVVPTGEASAGECRQEVLRSGEQMAHAGVQLH